MTNPFERRMANQKIGVAGRRSEKDLARKMGGKQTPASGASGMKGDIHLESFMIECKSTSTDTLSIKREWLLKVAREALSAGKTPALALTFTDDDGKTKQMGDWVAIPQYLFNELVNSSSE